MHARLHCRLGSRSPYRTRGRTEPPLERAARGAHARPAAQGAWGTSGHSPSWFPEATGSPLGPDPGQWASQQAPRAAAAPRHTGQLSRPRATGSSRVRLWPQPTRPVFSLPGRASAKPDCGRPLAGPGSTGDFPPGAGRSSRNRDKGSRRLDSQGRGHCRAAGPLWRPQGPASPPPAGCPLGGTGQQAPVMEEGRKGACFLVPSGEGPETQGEGPRLG